MRHAWHRLLQATIIALPAFGLSSAGRADSGEVEVRFTRGGLVLGLGRGQGVLYFRDHRYPFRVSGLSVGFTIGGSTARLSGTATNLIHASDIQGTYRLLGAGAALAAGAGSVRLQNERAVVLELSGPKLGAELSVALGGVRVSLQ
jgi:hypothetical protein